MADAAPQSFQQPVDNARDMADTIMQDVEGLLQGGEAPQDAAPTQEESLSEFGYDERGAEYGNEFQDLAPVDSTSVEPAEVTTSSLGSGSATSPAPAPQLDPTQQLLAAVMQRMETQNQQFTEVIKSLAPKVPEAPPADPFADMPKEYDTPEIRAFAEYMRKKVLAPHEEYKQSLEKRIQEATAQRQTTQLYNEAAGLGKSFASDLGAQGQDAEDLANWFHDQTIVFTNKYGGAPTQYATAIKDLFNKGVALKQAQLNSTAKAAVAKRYPGATARPQQATGSAMTQRPYVRPSDAEARAAGYKSAFEAALDGDAKVHQFRARQGAQGK